MTSVLIIGPSEIAALHAARERALARPIPLDILRRGGVLEDKQVVTLADRRKPESADLIRPESEHIFLPTGYRVSMSYEEQAFGLCLHLSMSSAKPGMVPRQEAVEMVLDALDIKRPFVGHVWLEEFEIDGKPGGMAINLLIAATLPAGGNA